MLTMTGTSAERVTFVELALTAAPAVMIGAGMIDLCSGLMIYIFMFQENLL